MGAWHSFELAILVQVTAITAGAAIALAVTRRRSALRHALGVVALALVLASPALALLLPRASWLGGVVASDRGAAAVPDRSAITAILHPDSQLSATASRDGHAADANPASVTTSPLTARAAWLTGGLTLLAWIWAAGLAVLSLWFFAMRGRLRTFAKSVVRGTIDERVASQVAQAFGIEQLPPIGVSDLAPMPLVLGCRRPLVILPRRLLETAPAARVRDVLIHEFAHVFRRDPWINLAQHAAGVLFWPHPGVHWLGRQIARSREEVCDNFVLAATDSVGYAQTLLELAEQYVGPRSALAPLGIFSRRWRLDERITDILDPHRIKATRASRLPVAAVALLLAVTCALIGGAGLPTQPVAARAINADPAPQAAVQLAGADRRQGSRPQEATAVELLAALAQDHGYGLAVGEDLRHVPLPYPEIRERFWHAAHPERMPADIPATMVFRWENDLLTNHTQMFVGGPNTGHRLSDLLRVLAKIEPQMIDGPPELLKTEISGDWTVRAGLSEERFVAALASILQNELSLPIQMEFRNDERAVYVARGDYFYAAGRQPDRSHDEIDFFGQQPMPDRGAGGGYGKFSGLLASLGAWIGSPIVSEVENPPAADIAWIFHRRNSYTRQAHDDDHDPDLVLANITAQTGLHFTKEMRSVKILFVSQAKPAD